MDEGVMAGHHREQILRRTDLDASDPAQLLRYGMAEARWRVQPCAHCGAPKGEIAEAVSDSPQANAWACLS